MADDSHATMIANLERITGKPFDAWLATARATGIAKPKALLDHLKAEHGLTHGYANFVALKALKSDSGSQDAADLAEQMFAGPKTAIRPVFDAVMAEVASLGGDVEPAQKKGYLSLRRKKQFALVQPSTKDRVDLGLILKGVAPAGRLEASGSFNAMVTHRVRLATTAEVDGEIEAWLKAAYDAAG